MEGKSWGTLSFVRMPAIKKENPEKVPIFLSPDLFYNLYFFLNSSHSFYLQLLFLIAGFLSALHLTAAAGGSFFIRRVTKKMNGVAYDKAQCPYSY
ncbi:MAG: hypothetical protein LUG18_08010 [Candidatus Azobacteroides sp.]|nr:hypothetical protein [Candidatus Azobacteroides sp.]